MTDKGTVLCQLMCPESLALNMALPPLWSLRNELGKPSITDTRDQSDTGPHFSQSASVYLPAKLEKVPAGHDVQAEAPVSRQMKRIDQTADQDTYIWDLSIVNPWLGDI